MAVEQELKEIREASARVASRKARAEVEVSNATERRDEAKKELKEEFGVLSSADARTKLAELQAAVEEAIADVRRELEEAGA